MPVNSLVKVFEGHSGDCSLGQPLIPIHTAHATSRRRTTDIKSLQLLVSGAQACETIRGENDRALHGILRALEVRSGCGASGCASSSTVPLLHQPVAASIAGAGQLRALFAAGCETGVTRSGGRPQHRLGWWHTVRCALWVRGRLYLVLDAHVALLEHLGSFAGHLASGVGGRTVMVLGRGCGPALLLVLALSFPHGRSSGRFPLSTAMVHVCLVGMRRCSVPLRHLSTRADRAVAAMAAQHGDVPRRRFLTEAIDPPQIPLGCIGTTASEVD